MTKRLQVLLEERELALLRRVSRKSGLSVAAWVRATLRSALREQPLGDKERKLRAVAVASAHAFPTAEVETMLAEIAAGRSLDLPE